MKKNEIDRIVLVDDDADQCALLAGMLASLGHEVRTTTSVDEALALVDGLDVSAVVTDLAMHGVSGVELCERVARARPDVPVIVVTGFASTDAVVAALRAGAFDFLTKPIDGEALRECVARALAEHRAHRAVAQLSARPIAEEDAYGLSGESSAMRRVRELVTRVAASDATVRIQGETGTGKERVARAIHAQSARSRGPFVAINCAAVQASLLESELFGHARGAFTDAKNARSGLLVKAEGGTLFLDEIGEMSPEMQTKLLRALQERVVRPIGGGVEVPFDARILVATHKDLEDEVDAGRFRQDLFYRINVVHIEVPPLRARDQDVLLLAAIILRRLAAQSGGTPMRIPPDVASRLLAYRWPGNVRELENCLERAVAVGRLDVLTLEDLPERIRGCVISGPRMGLEQEIVSIEELERRHILRVLRLVDNDRTKAARLLGVDRRTLYRRLDRYAAEAGRAIVPDPAS